MDNKAITILQIARLSGTSKQVVSCILGGGKSSSTRYSKKTLEKVTRIAKKYNYRPNRTSINLVAGKHGCITILFKNFYKIPFNSINFLIRRAETYGYTVNFELIKERSLLRCIFENSTDGLILFEDVGDDLMHSIEKFNIPHVLVNTNVRNQKNSITFDEEGMIKSTLDYFSKTGSTRPAMILGDELPRYAKEARYETAMKCYSTFGMQKPLIVDAEAGKTTASLLEETLSEHSDVDCLFIGNFFERYVLSLDKISKNRDITIAYVLASFNYINFPAANFSIHQKEVPETAVDLLNQIIENKAPCAPIIMQYNIANKK